MDQSATKHCKECEKEYPATSDFFHKDKKKSDGLTSLCKECACKRSREWHAAHRDEANAGRMARYRASDPQIEKAKRQKWHAEHRDEVSEHSREYREAHPEQTRQQQLAWYTANHEQAKARRREYAATHSKEAVQRIKAWRTSNAEHARLMRRTDSQRRRARQLQVGGSHTIDDIQWLLQIQQYRCFYCDEEFQQQNGQYIWHVDHFIPLAKGGSNHPDNLVLACPPCNLKKSDRFPYEWEMKKKAQMQRPPNDGAA